MQSFIALFFSIFAFWFFEAPKGLIAYFASLNNAFFRMFSLRILVTTYFKPWKNEYRQGMVGFAIFMGIFAKTFLILFDLTIFTVLLSLEIILIVAFLIWPMVTVWLLFS